MNASDLLTRIVEAMADEAFELGDPEVTNAVLIFQDVNGKVQALYRMRGQQRQFAEAVCQTGLQIAHNAPTQNH